MALDGLLNSALRLAEKLSMPHGKCKFSERCSLYDEQNSPCSKTAGSYYGRGRGGGCYRKLEREEQEKLVR